MPRSFEENKIIRDTKKREIREAALYLFSRMGFQNVRVDDITKFINSSHGHFYTYYKNKEEVFLAAERDVLTRNDGIYFIPFKKWSGQGETDGLKKVIDTFVRIFTAEEDVVEYYATLAMDDFDIQFVPSAFYEKTDKFLFRQMVKEAMNLGLIRSGDLNQLVNAFCDLAVGRLFRRIKKQGDSVSFETISRFF